MLEWTLMNITALRESGQAKGTGKRREAKILAADVWGSSAFYPKEVLARDAATAFPAGTKMFENHLTEAEQWERPVGDVGKLVGKLITSGEYKDDHPEGPGVYADVEFYDSYVDRINEIGDDVGLSVDGGADYVEGERDGRFGKIVTGIPFIRSVDVVVAAGAGGKLISIRESSGPMAGVPINTEGDQSMTAITKEDFDAGFKALGEALGQTLTTAIKESLTPTPVTEPAAAPAAEAPAAAAEGVVEAPTAAEVAPVAPAAETPAEPAAEVVIDHAALTSAIITAALPAEVVPAVVAAVQGGATVEDAISAQTVIREAFLANAAPGTFRIVESDRNNSAEGGTLRERILAATK